MRNGFTLIEMLVVIALASVLLMLLFGSFVQSNKLVRAADDYITLYTKVAIAHHQLDKDISGACVPLQVYAQETTKQKETQEKEEAILTKLFVATTQDNQLDMLTCVSNNPLQAYWSERIGKPHPHLVRIVYRLVKDEEDDLEAPPSFKLMRQSGANLDFDAYKADGTIREYELINRIKSISLSFKAIIETEEGAAKEKKITKELKTFDTWDSNSGEIISNNKRKYIPNAVTITLVLWDDQKIQDQEFVMTILIPADSRPLFAGEQEPPPKEELKKAKSMIRLPQQALPKEPPALPVLRGKPQ